MWPKRPRERMLRMAVFRTMSPDWSAPTRHAVMGVRVWTRARAAPRVSGVRRAARRARARAAKTHHEWGSGQNRGGSLTRARNARNRVPRFDQNLRLLSER